MLPIHPSRRPRRRNRHFRCRQTHQADLVASSRFLQRVGRICKGRGLEEYVRSSLFLSWLILDMPQAGDTHRIVELKQTASSTPKFHVESNISSPGKLTQQTKHLFHRATWRCWYARLGLKGQQSVTQGDHRLVLTTIASPSPAPAWGCVRTR